MEHKPFYSQNTEPLSFKPIWRFFRNTFLGILAFSIFVLIASEAYQGEQKKQSEIKPIWALRQYKDPMDDTLFSRLEIYADEVLELQGGFPQLVLECDQGKNGNKLLSVSIKSQYMLTPAEYPNLIVRFGDDSQTHTMPFSAFRNGKSLSPVYDEAQFILSLLTSDRLRVQIISGSGIVPFISFRLSPQDKAREYVKGCWGDYASLPASVSPNVAVLVWGMNGEWVTAYQRAMKAVGLYNGREDGIADPALFEALQKYAEKNHLEEVAPDHKKAVTRSTIREKIREDKRIREEDKKPFM